MGNPPVGVPQFPSLSPVVVGIL